MMSMDQTIKLPTGFRFNPFDKELITSYLKPKVLGHKLPCTVVEERQLYGPNADPWRLLDPHTHPWIECEVSPGKIEKVAYVFVHLSKKANPLVSKNKNNVGREQFIKRAGCGTWDGQTSRTRITDSDGHLIGEKRLLVFQVNELCDKVDLSRVGYWKMHEYSLCGVNNNVANPSNTVLCKITLDSSKNPPIKLKPTTGKPQRTNNKKNDNKNMVVNVCSPSTVCSAVVDADVEGISEGCGEAATQTCRDDGLELFDGPKAEELCYGSDVVETFDDAWINSIFDEADELETMSLLLKEVDPKQTSLDNCWPVNHDNGYQISPPVKHDNGYQISPSYEFESLNYLEPTHEEPFEGFATNLGKRKLQAETSYAMTGSGCSPFLGIEKAQVARVLYEPQLDPRRLLLISEPGKVILNG